MVTNAIYFSADSWLTKLAICIFIRLNLHRLLYTQKNRYIMDNEMEVSYVVNIFLFLLKIQL